MLVLRRDGEEGKHHDEDEDVIDREGFLDDEAGEKLQGGPIGERRGLREREALGEEARVLGEFPVGVFPEAETEEHRQTDPDDAPGEGLLGFNLVGVSMKDAEVEREKAEDAEREEGVEPPIVGEGEQAVSRHSVEVIGRMRVGRRGLSTDTGGAHVTGGAVGAGAGATEAFERAFAQAVFDILDGAGEGLDGRVVDAFGAEIGARDGDMDLYAEGRAGVGAVLDEDGGVVDADAAGEGEQAGFDEGVEGVGGAEGMVADGEFHEGMRAMVLLSGTIDGGETSGRKPFRLIRCLS